MLKHVSTLFLFLPFFSFSFAQTEIDPAEKPAHLRVFLDCNQCDKTYFREELNIVDYVRNRDEADVHVFVTSNRTSSQRIQFEISMLGRGRFENQNFNSTCLSQVEPTSNDIRVTLLESIKVGLVPYLSQTQLIDAVKVSIDAPKRIEDEPTTDPWNFWVFEVNGSGSWNKETSQSRLRYSSSLTAERVTEMWRIRSRAYLNGSTFNFDNDGEAIQTKRKSDGAYLNIVKSLGPHFSAGTSLSYSSSTFSNLAQSISTRLAFEYNIFPYTEVSKRELTIAYRVGPYFQRYDELTIYDQLDERLWRESLSINLRMRQPWGNAFAGLTGGHYFHDLSKYSVDLDGSVNLRLYKGLNVRFGGSFNLIRDQLSLPKGGASLEDVILQQRQIAKDFDSSLYAGIGFTFGSIYNNVVNTRL